MLPSGWIQGPVTALITLLFIIFLIIKPITKVRMSSNNQACYSTAPSMEVLKLIELSCFRNPYLHIA